MASYWEDRQDIPVGTFTLCGVCHFAVVLVLETWADYDTGEPQQAKRWKHVGRKGCGVHDVETPRWFAE